MRYNLTEKEKSQTPHSMSFKVQKRKTPPFIIAVFIGIPSAVCIILIGIIIRNLFVGSSESEPPTFDSEKLVKEAEQDETEGIRLMREAKDLENKGEGKRANALFDVALKFLKSTDSKYKKILTNAQEQGENIQSEDYGWLQQRLTVVNRYISDIIKRKPFFEKEEEE